MTLQSKLQIAGVTIQKGKKKKIDIEVAKLFDHTSMSIPVKVVRGKEDGPTLFISAGIHGDEINGVEIIKRLLSKRKLLANIKGTLICVPIVNIFGYNNKYRYLPDRRDLNRCFPGSETGSLGGQMAHIFMNEIVKKSTFGIDLHTGSNHRTNLPQIRACLDSPKTKDLAEAFSVPVILNSTLRDGSLRAAAGDLDIPVLVFEGGQSLRYEDKVIKSGLFGIQSVMHSIGMVERKYIDIKRRPKEVFFARSSHWIRSPHSGSLRVKKHLGKLVKKGEILGVLSNPFGDEKINVKAQKTGIIIGMNLLPLVNNGDALFHIATFEDSSAVEEYVERFDENLE